MAEKISIFVKHCDTYNAVYIMWLNKPYLLMYTVNFEEWIF